MEESIEDGVSFKGKSHSEGTKERISALLKGRISPMLGKKHSEGAIKKMSIAISGGNNSMFGKPGGMLGKKHSEEAKKKMSGDNHWNWKGGISCEPYCDIWLDQDFKSDIKERDNHICQNPDCWGNCDHLPLTIHHINHDKMDCPLQNLITLCRGCNSRANWNREYWVKLYQKIMTKKYGYCYG